MHNVTSILIAHSIIGKKNVFVFHELDRVKFFSLFGSNKGRFDKKEVIVRQLLEGRANEHKGHWQP